MFFKIEMLLQLSHAVVCIPLHRIQLSKPNFETSAPLVCSLSFIRTENEDV